MSGWIKISRSLFEHEFFAPEPFTEREAWLWMIGKAAWENTTHRVGNQTLEVSRGEFMTTLRELQLIWKWGSDTRIRNFLKSLCKKRMIERRTERAKNSTKTRITICNYDKYQKPEISKNASETQEETQARTLQKRTKEEINKTTLLSREEFCPKALEEKLRHAAGLENSISPALFQVSDPINWLNSGCDLELDILPVLKSKSGFARNVSTWAYFSRAVFEARDRRLAPAPKVVTHPSFSAQPTKSKTEQTLELIAEVVNERNQQNG